MYIKGTVICGALGCKEDIDIEIDPCGTKGSVYALDQDGFTFQITKITTKDKVYTVNVYKCTLGKGCRFKIIETRNINNG